MKSHEIKGGNMKRLLIMLAGLLVLAGAAFGDNFIAGEKTGDMTVKASIDSNPVKVGENRIVIEIFDGEMRPVTDALVSVYYFMPSMPAMNYEVGLSAEGTRYSAVIKPTMPGEWTADIRISRPGDERKVSITFQAR